MLIIIIEDNNSDTKNDIIHLTIDSFNEVTVIDTDLLTTKSKAKIEETMATVESMAN